MALQPEEIPKVIFLIFLAGLAAFIMTKLANKINDEVTTALRN